MSLNFDIFGNLSEPPEPKREGNRYRTMQELHGVKEGNLTTAEIARKHGIKWQSVHKLRRKLEADGEL